MFPSTSAIPTAPPIPLSLIQCTFYSDSACWQVFFFPFSLHASAWVARWGTAVYLPLAACSDNLAPFRGTRFGEPVKFRRRVVYRADKFVLRGRGSFVVFGDVTARRHLCREHPKGPTTPDPRGPLSLEEFEIARHRPFRPLEEAAGMWQTNYRRSFYVFRLASCLLNRKLECLVLRRRDLINIFIRDICGLSIVIY